MAPNPKKDYSRWSLLEGSGEPFLLLIGWTLVYTLFALIFDGAFFSRVAVEEFDEWSLGGRAFRYAAGYLATVAMWLTLRRSMALDRQNDQRDDQLEISRSGQVHEQFIRGAELLGQKAIAEKLAGIYALERLAKLDFVYFERVFDLLTMYLRTTCPVVDQKDPDPDGHQVLIPNNEIQEAQPILEVIARRFENLEGYEAGRRKAYVVDLSWCHLPRLRLQGGSLSGVNLSCSNLRNSTLIGTDLRGADMALTNLIWGNLRGAILTNTQTTGIKLANAFLEGTDLRGVNLHWRNLKGAKHDEKTLWPSGFDVSTIPDYEPLSPA